MTRRLYPAVCAALLLCLPAMPLWAAADTVEFPRPAALVDDIDFWRKVFTRIDSGQGYLHDSRHLNVIYATIRIPDNAGVRDSRRIVDQLRDRYSATLELLASGQRDGLDAEQLRVLRLWPADVSNAELREAAKRIRFQRGLANDFRDGVARSGAWHAYITEQLAAHEVPSGLAALPHVESSFNPEARSHVGAAGLWQFTRGTGRMFMQVDYVVDERRDPFRSSESAAKLLAYNYSVLQSWPLAITAYNHGAGGMQRAVRELGTDDIGVINREYEGPAFGFASRNFYPAFIAAMDVAAKADDYFGGIERQPPEHNVVVKLPRYAPVQAIAKAAGVSMPQLRASNPGLLKPVWDGTKHAPRGYQVRIPAELTDRSARQILAAIPKGQLFASQTQDQFHQVRPGESLSVIAARYDTSVRELAALNKLESRHMIRIGQRLRLPLGAAGIPVGAATYTVRSGDSLSTIAREAGVSQKRIMELNGLRDRHRIYVGQQLYLRSPEDEA